ncbi:MAG: aldose epimerase family protein [Leadbetterella sp.]
MTRIHTLSISILFFFISCESNSLVSVEEWGKLESGEPVQLYTLRNHTGMTVKISNYGGIITYLTAPDWHGAFDNVVLGFDSLNSYRKRSPYFGCIIGRNVGRISKSNFMLDDSLYQLGTNDYQNHLHGGKIGLDKKVWKAKVTEKPFPTLELSYTSPDGEEGYPGRVEFKVLYTLTHENVLRIDYYAVSNKTTYVSLSNHTYFNLNGSKKTILDHGLRLSSTMYSPVDSDLTPLGYLENVETTPFDFRNNTAIGPKIRDYSNVQIKRGGGYDHCFILNGNKKMEDDLIHVAELKEAFTGRKLNIFSSEPAVHVYTANNMMLENGSNSKKYGNYAGICLMPMQYPDAPNQEKFPKRILKPGEYYHSVTMYKFTFGRYHPE